MTNPAPQASQGSQTLSLAALALAGRQDGQPTPGVKRRLWRKDDDHAHVADQAFAPLRDTVLKRDNYSCRYCAFNAARYQEVHHLDDNHANNDPSNLLTVCNLCHQVHHLGMCGMRGAGFFAAIPELTQTEVNQIARAHFIAELISADQSVKDRLTGLYALLRARADVLKTAFKLDISSPLHFAEILSACEDDLYAQRGRVLGCLRLVPTRQAFQPGQLDYYAVHLRPRFLPENWGALTRQMMA